MRTGAVTRKTSETDISVQVNLDGSGSYSIETGVGFFDHMLEQLSKHSLIDVTLKARGDLHIDSHHTVEDAGIALGMALREAAGDKAGIRRYGSCMLPMDEALAQVALDFCGRAHLRWDVVFPSERIGAFDTELAREFFQALAANAGLTLHVTLAHGSNSHHIAESIFKAVAQALRQAVEADPRNEGQAVSTKGSL